MKLIDDDGAPMSAHAVQDRQGQEDAPRPRGRRGPIFWATLVAVVALLGVLVVGVVRPAPNNPLSNPNRVADDFALPLYTGGAVHLAALRGKTVVLNFWWAGCQPCVDEAAILEKGWRTWQKRGVVFIGVNTQDDEATARRFLHTYHVTYPTGSDPSSLSISYGATGTPETFVISPRGTIRFRYAQPFTNVATLDNLIAEVHA